MPSSTTNGRKGRYLGVEVLARAESVASATEEVANELSLPAITAYPTRYEGSAPRTPRPWTQLLEAARRDPISELDEKALVQELQATT